MPLDALDFNPRDAEMTSSVDGSGVKVGGGLVAVAFRKTEGEVLGDLLFASKIELACWMACKFTALPTFDDVRLAIDCKLYVEQ